MHMHIYTYYIHTYIPIPTACSRTDAMDHDSSGPYRSMFRPTSLSSFWMAPFSSICCDLMRSTLKRRYSPCIAAVENTARKELYYDRPSAPLEIKPRMLDTQVVLEMNSPWVRHTWSPNVDHFIIQHAAPTQRTPRFSCCGLYRRQPGRRTNKKTTHNRLLSYEDAPTARLPILLAVQ